MFNIKMDDYTFVSVVLSKGTLYSTDGYVENLFLGRVLDMLMDEGYDVTDLLDSVVLIVGDKFVEFGLFESDSESGISLYMDMVDMCDVEDFKENPEFYDDVRVELLDFTMNEYLYDISLERHRLYKDIIGGNCDE